MQFRTLGNIIFCILYYFAGLRCLQKEEDLSGQIYSVFTHHLKKLPPSASSLNCLEMFETTGTKLDLGR